MFQANPLPDWVWKLTATIYFLSILLYHFLQSIQPYQGVRKWLVFLDLGFLTFLEYVGVIANPVAMALRYLQVALVAIHVHSPNCRFFSLYLLAMGLSSSISFLFQGYSIIPLFVYSSLQVLSLTLLFFIITCQRKWQDWQDNALGLEKERKSWRRITLQQKFSQINKSCSHALLKYLYTLCKSSQKLQEMESRGISEKWLQVREALQRQIDLVLLVEARLLKKPAPKEAIKSFEENLKLESYLQKYFQDALVLNQFLTTHSPENVPKLQIHVMDEASTQSKISSLGWWVVFRWLDYFLVPGRWANGLKIVLCSSPNQISVKGVSNIKVQEVNASEDNLSCPLCQSKVKTLYNPFPATLGSCKECLKHKVEQQLKRDWEILPAEKPQSTPLWLAKQLVAQFELGDIQYGIGDWNSWEYFVELIIKKSPPGKFEY
jgi:hypothetical protein